ncbi:MAG TPA: DUF5682 family protein [Ktedonobacteraceae bacterium]|jgi:hypothetical protein
MSVSIFGIRHHGPGCARSLRAALEALEPDIVLVEGPPDAQEVIPLLAAEGMKPPVALLIYAPEKPAQAVYYPFATFSPEWQTLSYALAQGIPARFMDLPQAFQLGREEEDSAPATPAHQAATGPQIVADTPQAPQEPLDLLARAAGYSDYELWWERQIEQRRDMQGLFEGILEAMSELRADPTPQNAREAQREAHMRQSIRAARQEGFQRIAVVCGAWHAPVLTAEALQAMPGDSATLSGLKRIKVEATWIPWTSARLSYRSGYGAGVTSPGWYEHIWTARDRASIHWSAQAARLLRSEGLDASSASVIETVRLAETLAALRGLSFPGLAELHESIQTVLCHGNAEPMALIRQRLEIGDRLGEVPADTPVVPLQRDLENKQRRLRLKPSTAIEKLDLDLRKERDRACSRLYHQLRLLNIEWGQPQRGASRQLGTFHEYWQVQWQVEFVVKLIEANIWGNTIEKAASGYARHLAEQASSLPELTELLNRVVLAELPEAIEHLLTCVQTRAAVAADVRQMMDALPPLALVAREGDVRETKSAHLLPVIDSLFERIVIGLPGACASLDDEAAQTMVKSLNQADYSLEKLNREEQYARWLRVLSSLATRESIHGLVRGRCCRILFDKQQLSADELQGTARLALSSATPAAEAAAWIEGVLQGSGQLLLNQNGLWQALDRWLGELVMESFTELLPLLRRAFAGFSGPERRAMGETVRRLHATAGADGPRMANVAIDHQRASRVLPILAQLLGVSSDGN